MSNRNNSMVSVEVSDINFAEYQRPISKARVDKMVEEFEPHRMRPIEVSFRDGKYWCFDGQHRLKAFQKMGISRIPAQMHFGLSYEDEAYLFAKQHENEGHVNIRDRWNAGNIAGEKMQEIVEIKKILGEYGYSITPSPMPGKSNVFSCVATIMKGHKDFGAAGLRQVLDVMDGAWKGCAKVTSAEIPQALFRIYGTYGKTIDYDRLIGCLKKHTASSFLRDSQDETGTGGAKVARHMVRVYNTRLRKNKLDMAKIKG